MSRDALMSPDDDGSPRAIRRMFNAIARRYDRANHLMSLGLDRGWRRKAVEALAPQGGGRYLDVGCGTGDVALEILRRCPGASVVGIDAALGMLKVAAAKLEGAGSAALQAGDATALAFRDGAFEGVISAFCIRNVADRAMAFAEMRRVLVPGGRVVILELTLPTSPLLRFGHWLYNRTVVPVVGRLLTRAKSPFRYLVNSVRDFPRAEAVLSIMAEAGLRQARHLPLTGGTATLFVGEK